MAGDSVEKITKNGEITFDGEKYTVWDENYAYPVCVTAFHKIAESALEVYANEYLDCGEHDNS